MRRLGSRASKAVLRGTGCLALLGAAAFPGCGRSSKDAADGKGGAGGAPVVGNGGKVAESGAQSELSGGVSSAALGGSNSTSGGSIEPEHGGSGPMSTGGVAATASGGVPLTGLAGADAAQAGSAGAGGEGEVSCRDLCAEQGPVCCGAGLSCVREVEACRFDFLLGMVGSASDYPALEQAVASRADQVAFSIPDADFALVAAELPPTSRFELRLTAEASTVVGPLLEGSYRQPFRLVCGERTLFWGLTYEWYGAAALSFPVMGVYGSNAEELVLRLGAWQPAWALTLFDDPAGRERLDRPEFRAPFCARGVLSELEPL